MDLVVLDQGIDTSTAVGLMLFQILGSIAEFEYALMSERTMDGRAGQRPHRWAEAEARAWQVTSAREMYDERGEDGKRRSPSAGTRRS